MRGFRPEHTVHGNSCSIRTITSLALLTLPWLMWPQIKLASGHVDMLMQQSSFEHFVMAAINMQGAVLFPVKALEQNLCQDSAGSKSLHWFSLVENSRLKVIHSPLGVLKLLLFSSQSHC